MNTLAVFTNLNQNQKVMTMSKIIPFKSAEPVPLMAPNESLVDLDQLTRKVRIWAEERNILLGSTPLDQSMKLFSEFGELADNVGKGRDTKDDIGDVLVVTIIMSTQMNFDIIPEYEAITITDLDQFTDKQLALSLNMALCSFVMQPDNESILQVLSMLSMLAAIKGSTLAECLGVAYNDIKDRKGRMENGVFIKESDTGK